jgi:chemotaxis protein MotB
MPRRRKHSEEHENHERWLVSYADFITLLFAFFVVMYSLSSVNEGKYRILSDSLVSAFRSLNVNESGQQIVLPPTVVAPPRPSPVVLNRPPRDDAAEARRAAQVQRMQDMAESIRRVLEPLTRSGQVSVTEGAHGITVEINASVLFRAGEAALGPAAAAPLEAVAQVLAGAEFPVIVEGHTDDLPISTFRFPSNWELSSARASSVVRLFVESGVTPDRLTAAGYSDQRPIANNLTEEGRSRNRRVTIRMETMFAEPEQSTPGRIRPDDPIRSILPENTGVPAV